jgi:hypothetical protein
VVTAADPYGRNLSFLDHLRSINLLILFGIRKNCVTSGRSFILHQFTRSMIKLIVVIILGSTAINLKYNFILILLSRLSPYTDCWVSSVWVST